MKKRLLAMLLVLVMVVSLLPTAAFAAKENLPDWHFLCVIFKNTDAAYKENSVPRHVKKDLSAGDIQILRNQIKSFESFMAETGVMTPHVDIVELDTPLEELESSVLGPFPSAKYLTPIFKSAGIDIDQYDHIIAFANMDTVQTSYWGVTATGVPFENGTPYSFFKAEVSLRLANGSTPLRPTYAIVHEFLHTMQSKFDGSYDLHEIEADIVPNYSSDAAYKDCMLDIIHNRIKGGHGSGVPAIAWSYSPCTVRELSELMIPDHVSMIGECQFTSFRNLEKVVLPSGITSIGAWAFENCTSLESITIPASVTSIGQVAFNNTGLKDVYYEGTEAQWKAIEISGWNEALVNATIHYNSPMAERPVLPTVDDIAATGTAVPTPQTVKLDGKDVEFQTYAIKDAKGNDTNYVKIRDLANVLNGTKAQFNVDWNGSAVVIDSGKSYAPDGSEYSTPYSGNQPYQAVSSDSVSFNGSPVNLTSFRITHEGKGYTYYKFRDLGQLLDFEVRYDGGIIIETDKPFTGK